MRPNDIKIRCIYGATPGRVPFSLAIRLRFIRQIRQLGNQTRVLPTTRVAIVVWNFQIFLTRSGTNGLSI
jgi:hypothetical protein